jgi:hypothetical protein
MFIMTNNTAPEISFHAGYKFPKLAAGLETGVDVTYFIPE